MTDETSPRLGLPLLQIGQAQKEMAHNEALMLLDLSVQAVVETVGRDAPPLDPAEGACWIVGTAPTGAWTGQARALAGWTSGGWRFVAARTGLDVWSKADGSVARFDGGVWVTGTISGSRLVLGGNAVVGARQPAIAAPASGTVIDIQARVALGAILLALRNHGLIAV